jgi:A/G-specific adenine glycosylase
VLDPSLTAALIMHFDANRRAMPWRDTADPYAIWVSEVMLQQTRVEAVRPYYVRWLERFPTVAALADAELDEVLCHWQGLGYYSRARNLHSAARLVREQFGGVVPSDPSRLRELPGIGEYTAGAVASIAYGAPVPAIDGNARRVLARLRGLEDPTANEIRRLAEAMVPDDRPGDFNQALMELGATVCSPRSPACGSCPVAGWCRARAEGKQEVWPRPAKRPAVPHETVTTTVVQRDDSSALLARRPEAGFLGGMWEFPGGAPQGWVDAVKAVTVTETPLEPIHQAYSHKSITYRPTLFRLTPGVVDLPFESDVDTAWVPLDRLDAYALPVAQVRIADRARSTAKPV